MGEKTAKASKVPIIMRMQEQVFLSAMSRSCTACDRVGFSKQLHDLILVQPDDPQLA